MNYHHKARKILVTGQSGSGKTTLWLQLLRSWRARWKFVFDPERECAHKLGWPVATAANQLEWAAVRGAPVCFDSTDMFPGDRVAGFEFFCGWVMGFVSARHPGNAERGLVNGAKVVAVDELQNYTDPGRGGVPYWFQVMLDSGRREEVDLLLCAQALNEVNHGVRRQLTEIASLRQSDSLALEWLESRGLPAVEVARLPVPGGVLWLDVLRRTIRKGGKWKS